MTATLRSRRELAGLVLSVLVLPDAACAVGAPRVTVTSRDGGGLVVENGAGAPVRLNGAVAVDGFDGKTWKPLITEMSLVAACDPDGVVRPSGVVVLGARQVLRPPPWRGWSCSGQCEAHCRSNIYWGSGPFRFRLTEATTGAEIASGRFSMPAHPAI